MQTSTSAAGAYTLSLHVSKAAATVIVSKLGYHDQTASFDPNARNADVTIRPKPVFFEGFVRDVESGAPVAAVVSIEGSSGNTDASGHYTVYDPPAHGGPYLAHVVGGTYEPDVRYVLTPPQDFLLRPVLSASADKDGEVFVTVSPTDELCENQLQKPTVAGPNFVCRTLHLHTSIPNQVLFFEAVDANRNHPQVEFEIPQASNAHFRNPGAIGASPGLDVRLNIGIPATSTSSQTFDVTFGVEDSFDSARVTRQVLRGRK